MCLLQVVLTQKQFIMYQQNNAIGNANNIICGLGFGPFDFTTPGLNILKGKVVDYSTNKPLSGAHVYYIKNGKEIGVITNQNGEYELEASPNDVITISFMGYEPIQDLASKIGEVEYLSTKAEQLKTIYLTDKKPVNKSLLLGVGVAAALIIGVSLANSEDKTE